MRRPHSLATIASAETPLQEMETDPARLRVALQRGVEWHCSALEARGWRQTVGAGLRDGERQFTGALASAEVRTAGALDAMLAVLSTHHPDAYEHARRVARHSVSIARVLGFKEPSLSDIERGALLHDIGKIAIPEGILLKPAALDDQETRLMRRHPEIGYRLIKHVPMFAAAAEIVLGSHEAFDGRGYPRGLVGDAIPIGARIVAVTDAYDSMTHLRVYRHALTAADATREILHRRGTQFDPFVVDAMLTLLASHGGPRQPIDERRDHATPRSAR
ncbi:MAG: HD domain-containing protein [Acidobacteria bacterium]|nr:HD domain-containing protein [Acidobacteriota bacterium]